MLLLVYAVHRATLPIGAVKLSRVSKVRHSRIIYRSNKVYCLRKSRHTQKSFVVFWFRGGDNPPFFIKPLSASGCVSQQLAQPARSLPGRDVGGMCVARSTVSHVTCAFYRHIDTALAGTPLEQRCSCKPRTQAEFDQSGGGFGLDMTEHTNVLLHRRLQALQCTMMHIYYAHGTQCCL